MAATWATCFERHFQRYFQKPFDIQTYHTDDDTTLRLATYDKAYREFRVYASLGLADRLTGEPGEAFTLVDDFGPDVPFLFANALLFILTHDIPLASRFTLGGIEALRPQFAEFFDKTALYFMPAEGFAEGFERVKCNEAAGKPYQAIFISADEDDYIREKGGAAFEARIKAQEADVCRLRRLSCV